MCGKQEEQQLFLLSSLCRQQLFMVWNFNSFQIAEGLICQQNSHLNCVPNGHQLQQLSKQLHFVGKHCPNNSVLMSLIILKPLRTALSLEV